MEIAFSDWVIKLRWWIIIVSIIVVAAAASVMRFLTFENDLRVFFSEKNPQLQALEAMENTYNKLDNVYFIIAPQDKNIFTRETLAAIEELTETSWHIPYSSRVYSITNFQYTYSEYDHLIVEDLVVDDEGEYVEVLEERLALRGLDVKGALSGERAIEILESDAFDVVVLDVMMPGMGGIAALVEIKKKHPDTQVIMLSGHAEMDTAIKGMELGAFDYLVKPVNLDELLYKIEDAAKAP